MKLIPLLLALLLLDGCGAQMDSAAACAFVSEADVPLAFQSNLPIVEARINGKPAHLILDTGSTITILTEPAAERLGIARDSTMHAISRVVGGVAAMQVGNVARLEMAAARQTDMPVFIVMKTILHGEGVDGLIGADVLSKYDVDLDFPHQMFRLYKARNCPSGAPNWAETATRLPRLAGGHAQPANYFRTSLDGTDLNTVLDTGASYTAVERKSALALGVSEKMLLADPQRTAQGVAPERVQVVTHRFSSVVIGNETIRRPNLMVTTLTYAPSTPLQMLLGVDYLKRHRAWLSYDSYAAYVALPAQPTHMP